MCKGVYIINFEKRDITSLLHPEVVVRSVLFVSHTTTTHHGRAWNLVGVLVWWHEVTVFLISIISHHHHLGLSTSSSGCCSTCWKDPLLLRLPSLSQSILESCSCHSSHVVFVDLHAVIVFIWLCLVLELWTSIPLHCVIDGWSHYLLLGYLLLTSIRENIWLSKLNLILGLGLIRKCPRSWLLLFKCFSPLWWCGLHVFDELLIVVNGHLNS